MTSDVIPSFLITPYNKMSSNKSSFLQYLHLFWPGRHVRAAVEPNSSKEWTGKTMYFNFSSIFGDFFLNFFEESRVIN